MVETSLSSFFQVFGRHYKQHPFWPCLVKLLTDKSKNGESNHAIALNIIHDWRISVNREKKILKEWNDTRKLEKFFTDYFYKNIRESGNPEFLDLNVNKDNIIDPPAASFLSLRKDLDLVRVFNLSNLQTMFLKYRNELPWLDWLKGRTIDNNEQYQDFMDEYLGDRSKRRDFLEAIFTMLNREKERIPFHPAWVTFWDRFVEAVPNHQSHSKRWNEVVGVPVFSASWVILLKYTVGEAGTLVRPTQLDAGWSKYHFPNPPGMNKVNGGIAMDLIYPRLHHFLLPEFIHEQNGIKIEYWDNAGSCCEKVPRDSHFNFPILREQHRQFLEKQFGMPDGWMKPPI